MKDELIKKLLDALKEYESYSKNTSRWESLIR